MTSINKVTITNLNNEFQQFRTSILQSKTQNGTYLISQLSQYEKKYAKLGCSTNFAQMLYSFAQILKKQGLTDLAGIILSNLIKLPFIKPQVKEMYINSTLEIYRESGDSLHALARLVDLKILYKQTKQNHKYMQTLFDEEAELRKICANFKTAKQNFRTYSRINSLQSTYELELAKVRVDISKMLLNKNPKKAEALLNKARATFIKAGREKEVIFVNTLLSEISSKIH